MAGGVVVGARACACGVLVLVAGCGGGGGSSSKTNTSQAGKTQSTQAAKPGVDPGVAKNLGKADSGQLQRGQAYTTCIAQSQKGKNINLTFREGTDKEAPVIIGTLHGLKFGITLGSSPADAKAIEKKIRATTGNNALLRRGSTVIAFGGTNPKVADINIVTTCADKVQ